MKFYIVKKDNSVAVIPAQTEQLNEYQKRGFEFVEVVAACDKNDALDRFPKHSKKRKKWLVLCSSLVVISITFSLISAIFVLMAK
ncbi:hypothetical protein [Pseudoalteromonas rhizosphaerae]|uniref:hypothetical protein n=1 Tax=Pseudoalteromonas rhizosphaerae TaxID=2518973 RepID=UPI0012311014|nr:hypothetical protein [Pseudoalteromonas rhizosphaerae]